MRSEWDAHRDLNGDFPVYPTGDSPIYLNGDSHRDLNGDSPRNLLCDSPRDLIAIRQEISIAILILFSKLFSIWSQYILSSFLYAISMRSSHGKTSFLGTPLTFSKLFSPNTKEFLTMSSSSETVSWDLITFRLLSDDFFFLTNLNALKWSFDENFCEVTFRIFIAFAVQSNKLKMLATLFCLNVFFKCL